MTPQKSGSGKWLGQFQLSHYANCGLGLASDDPAAVDHISVATIILR